MTPAHAGLALLTTALWGFNFVMIQVGLDSGLPPLLMAVLRFVVAGLPALWLPRPRIAGRRLVAISLFLFVGQFALLFTGMAAGMPPGLASVTQQSQAFLTALSLLLEGPGAIGHALANLNAGGVSAVLYLAVAATLGGYGIWGFLMARYPATVVAPFALLVPITGAASAALVMGEGFGGVRLAGMGLIVAGLVVGTLRWRRDPGAPAR